MHISTDLQFQNYFQGLKQVFLYVTDDCGLVCRQCLYKPWLRKDEEIDPAIAETLLAGFHELGAVKLSFLGGEPTDYQPLPLLISYAKKLGYEYIRLDTNGQFGRELLEDPHFQRLDELTFSLDGDTAKINDRLRGAGAFEKCLANLKIAIKLGYDVDITCCVHRWNIGKDENGDYLLDRMIKFASSIGVQRINFHPLFRMGVPRDNWAGETDISPEEWIILYSTIRKNVEDGNYEIPVRIPQRFVPLHEFKQNPAYYGYCPVKMGERVLVHANGQIQICALMIGTPYSVARFGQEDGEISITWEKENNELEYGDFDPARPTPCTHQSQDFGDYIPLCISFKPQQDEFIWEKLGQEWVLRFRGTTTSA